ncbi:MAG: SGNH/GDSL hydrolase family protein [Bradyrhizobium sp.]|nr:SGNH/GDSL hydrolase family protein [Bradyrhizobium sp.]
MEVDPSQIPVEAIPFEHGLANFAQRLKAKAQAKIVAIGSSTTSGHRDVKPYPERLKKLLHDQYRDVTIEVVNKGINGQEAPAELERFDRDVFAEKPDLVIWQVGTNTVWQPPDHIPPPPTLEATLDAIREGLARLVAYPRADVIMMDLQYVPAVLTPAKIGKATIMVREIGKAAQVAGVNVFRRFAFMKALHEVEKISFDRMVNPEDDDRLHDSDWVTGRISWALKQAIVGGIKKAQLGV